MRYYVAADVHGFYDKFMEKLTEAGFFRDTEPHKLVVCGDLFDRGEGTLQLQEFILRLMEEDRVILVRGNHEDLAMMVLQGWASGTYLQSRHNNNGTVSTVCHLAGVTIPDLLRDSENVGRAFLKSPYIQTIIPATVDYFETEHYIFVHGWIPCEKIENETPTPDYRYLADWRKAGSAAWEKARWINGMEAAHGGVTEPGKTIVCGHWNTSFAHSRYEGRGSEFGEGADYSPYVAPGIIALDACTAISGEMNLTVIED